MSGGNGTNGKNGNGKAPAGPVRCAIYTRKSTTEGLDSDFNTLDAQRESAEHYIRAQAHQNWTILPARYDDGGFTGANIERPALERLMDDIERGAVDLVIVYKVDRLSRSLLDFARLTDANTVVIKFKVPAPRFFFFGAGEEDRKRWLAPPTFEAG